MVLLHKLWPQLCLVGWVLIVDIENFRSGPDILRGIPVAAYAPVHIERIDFIRQRHFIDLAMAGGTADAFVQVNAVVKVNEVRKIVYARPFNGFAGRPTIPNRLRDRGA